MKFLMISCKKATELADKRQAVGLTIPEQVKLRIHTAMCDACRRYEEQSGKIEAMLKKQLDPSSHPGHVSDERAHILAERILSKKK